MKLSAFYHRAFSDPAFRSEKLEEARYLRNVFGVTLWCCVGLGAVVCLYLVLNRAPREAFLSWTQLSWLVTALGAAAARADFDNRVAALEAFASQPPKP